MKERFGRWTVLGDCEPQKRRYVVAQCSCGTVMKVVLNDLRSGKSKSCGCRRRERKPTSYMKQLFGRWTVIAEGTPGTGRKQRTVVARCSCGTVKELSIYTLRYGQSKSCGCWKREQTSKTHRTHGESHKTVEYHTWKDIRARCSCKTNESYVWYGARGIRVCRRWEKYENFLMDMGRRPPNTSIERRDNNGDYTPSNCYWATLAQQARNKRTNRWLTYEGITLTITDWARRLCIDLSTLQTRLARDWPPDDVFSPRKHAARSRLARRKEKQ